MRIMKIFVAALCLTAVSSSAVSVSAAYKDVPESNFYYSAVSKVGELGLMSGDSAGNFGLNDMISKFDAAVVFAKAAGYKADGATADEKAEYERVYGKYAADIAAFSARYAKWVATANYPIAYLMDKGVLGKDDLSGFFRNVDGQDKLRALSKEEACAYLTKVIGKDKDALALTVDAGVKFKDDGNIAPEFRQYVYYMKALGVVSGDGGGSFNPNSGATKAMLAVMLSKLADRLPVSAAKNAPSAGTTASSTVSGVVGKLYPSFKAFLVETGGESRVLPLTDDALVTVNGKVAAFGDISIGDKITAEIGAAGVVKAVITNDGAPSQNEPQKTPETGAIGETDNKNAEIQSLEGYVVSVKEGSIEVELRLLSIKGEVYTEKRNFAVGSSADVRRNGVKSALVSAKPADAARILIKGGMVISVDLTEKFRAVSGAVLEKNIDKGVVIYTILDDATGLATEITVGSDAMVTRNGLSAGRSDIRVGDRIASALSYYDAITLSATAEKTTAAGRVTEILLTAKSSWLTITGDDGKDKSFYAFDVELYGIRIGDTVMVTLDSKEVVGVVVTMPAVR